MSNPIHTSAATQAATCATAVAALVAALQSGFAALQAAYPGVDVTGQWNAAVRAVYAANGLPATPTGPVTGDR